MSLKKRIVIILSIIAVISGVSVGIWFLLRSPGEDADVNYRTGTVVQGDINEVVNVTAPLIAEQQSNLMFFGTGEVVAVYVEQGDRVHEGDILAELDSTQLQFDIEEAEIALELQKLAYEQILSGPSEAEVSSAEAAVWRAQAQLGQITQSPDWITLEVLQADIHTKIVERDQALRDYEFAVDLFGEGPLVDIAYAQLNSAMFALEQAEKERDSRLEGPSEVELSSAYASLAQSQAILELMTAGPTEIDKALFETQIAMAELALSNIKAALENMQIEAPFDGIVSMVNVQVGELAAPGFPAIIILDESAYHFDVLVDEIDIARIAENQEAQITLDALPELQLNGYVSYISPVATSVGGITHYKVRVDILPVEDILLRNGMTGTVTIVIADASDVLLVPNWAVRLDYETGAAYVNVRRADNLIEEIQIETGIRGTAFTEVVSGLSSGDEVVLSQQREEIDLFE